MPHPSRVLPDRGCFRVIAAPALLAAILTPTQLPGAHAAELVAARPESWAVEPAPIFNLENMKGAAPLVAPPLQTLDIAVHAYDSEHLLLVVFSDLPRAVNALLTVSLAGHNPDYAYSGFSRKLRIGDGGVERILVPLPPSGQALPDGFYDVLLKVDPRWAGLDGAWRVAQAGPLEARATIPLFGQRTAGASNPRWRRHEDFLDGLVGGPWRPEGAKRALGPMRVQPTLFPEWSGRYYFPHADVTLAVDRRADRVVTWRPGAAREFGDLGDAPLVGVSLPRMAGP